MSSRNVRGHVVVDHVTKTFLTKDASVEAIREASLDIREREFVTLIGPSGCGKSTLLRIIGGLIDPTSGRVEVRGHSPLEAQRTKDIGFVFQQPALLPWRSVERNMPFSVTSSRCSVRSAASATSMLSAGRRALR